MVPILQNSKETFREANPVRIVERLLKFAVRLFIFLIKIVFKLRKWLFKRQYVEIGGTISTDLPYYY